MTGEALTGPERMMQTIMKAMGINPKELVDRFQQPIEQGLAGIKDVDTRLKNLENQMSRILEILEASNERPRLHVIDSRTSSDDSPAGDFQRFAG